MVIATIDYHIEKSKTLEFHFDDHYKRLKQQTEENFQKGRLTQLKRWFRDLTEMQIECRDFKFNQYLRTETKYDIDIFKSFFERIEKIIEKGKITTDNQFYDTNIMIEELCQTDPVDAIKIQKLNQLISDYEKRKRI